MHSAVEIFNPECTNLRLLRFQPVQHYAWLSDGVARVTPRRGSIETLVIAAITLVLFAHNALAAPTVRIVEKGVYRAETTARTITKEATGILNTVQNVRLISDSTVVYGKIGIRFGIRYALSKSSAASENLKLVLRFPAPGLLNPATGARYAQSERMLTVETGSMNYWEYNFENDWEIVPGLWEFEFWADAKKLASQVFCVIDTSQALYAATNRECLPLVSRSSSDHFPRR